MYTNIEYTGSIILKSTLFSHVTLLSIPSNKILTMTLQGILNVKGFLYKCVTFLLIETVFFVKILNDGLYK